MLNPVSDITLRAQYILQQGTCNRCKESKHVNTYGLCAECDHQVDEEYEILYQEPLEVDVNQ